MSGLWSCARTSSPSVAKGLDIDTATDDDVIGYILANTELDLAELQSERLIVEPPDIGWVQHYVDTKIGGWRLAPQPLANQLRDLETRERASGPGPLMLIPRREKHHENSKLLELRDKPYIILNPADAEAASIEEGAKVEVRSVNGSVQRVVKIDKTLRPGAVNVPHGWSDELNVNRLTGTTDVDPITGMVLYSGLEVSLHPV